MVDLFRYIEHDFAVPAKTDAIDVGNDSDFQQQLRRAAGEENAEGTPAERVRALASGFLDETYPSPTSEPATLGEPLAGLRARLRELDSVTAQTVRAAIRDELGGTPDQLVAGTDLPRDRELLENAVVAAKLLTAFDRVDVARVTRQVAAVALVALLADDDALALDRAKVRQLLSRPLRIPSELLTAVADRGSRGGGEAPGELEPVPDEHEELRAERDRVRSAYDALVALDAAGVEMRQLSPLEPPDDDVPVVDRRPDDDGGQTSDAETHGASVLRLTDVGLAEIGEEQRAVLADLRLDPTDAPVPRMVERLERRLAELNASLLPLEVATSAPVFRVGGRLLLDASTPLSGPAGPAAATAPDFSAAVTRPVGVGNLHVVRQELIGYRPGAVSHIENVLEGELLYRRTRRFEFTETFETLETTTAQSQERDQQSTAHQELASEVQRESGQQSSKAGDGMSSSDYGKLVENSRSNYAQTLVSKSVESITQQVHQTRGRREQRSFTERVRHTLDNSDGTTKIRGIYQWVDKEYSLRVLNYGKRLMYDVVVPEPAAVLVGSIQAAVQPESFQLVKPLRPTLTPSGLDAGNYQWYAAQYGVTGAVAPPPAVYDKKTVSAAMPVLFSDSGKAYGGDVTPSKTGAFQLTIPDGYQALSGYVQMINSSWIGEAPGRPLEVFVGEFNYVRLRSAENPYLNKSFTMNGETGQIPVTWRAFPKVVSLSFATGIVCRRTDAAFAEWQLRTHAAIMSGYQRQLADYEDKLNRYVAAFRAQIAAGGLGHDPQVVLEELKRAFVFLLLGEHPATWLPTPTPAPAPPAALPPDPLQVREWGAVVAFFERAFEWENLMFTCYPYFWARPQRWQELMLMQDGDPAFEAFLKAGAARVVVPVRPGFEAALAHYQETGDVWMGEEMPDMFGDNYLSIIDEIKAANYAPGKEVCVDQWKVTLPTTLVLLKEDSKLPSWTPTPCGPSPDDAPPEP